VQTIITNIISTIIAILAITGAALLASVVYVILVEVWERVTGRRVD